MILKDLLNEPVARFNTITRFQGNDFIGDKESIAQHSFWVVIITDMIHEKLFIESDFKNKIYKKLIRKSIYHEMDETILGNDITHPLKYNKVHGEKLREIIDSVVIDLASQGKDSFSEMYYNEVLNVNKKDVFDLICSKIIKVADWLSFLAVCINQYNIGNKSVVTMKNVGVTKLGIVIGEFSDLLRENNIDFNIDFFNMLIAELVELQSL